MNQYCAAVVEEGPIPSLSLATISDGHVAESLQVLKNAVGSKREVYFDALTVIGAEGSKRDP